MKASWMARPRWLLSQPLTWGRAGHLAAVYLFGVLLCSRLLPLSEPLKALLAASVLLLLPERIGKLPASILGAFTNRQDGLPDGYATYILHWCTGTVLIALTAYQLSALGVFTLSSLSAIILFGLVVGMILELPRDREETGGRFFGLDLTDPIPLLITLVIGLAAAGFLVHRSPYPYRMGFDPFQIEHLIWKARNLNEFHLSVHAQSPLVYRIDEFRSFWLLIAISSHWANCLPLGVFWWGPFFTIPLMALGMYRFAYHFSHSRLVAVVGALASAWITEWGSGPVGVWIFRDATPVLLMSIYLLPVVDRADTRSFARMVLILALFGAFYHRLEVALLLGLLTAYYLLKHWSRRRAVAATQALSVLLVVFLVVAQRRQELLSISPVGIGLFSYSHFARETAALTIPERIQRLEEFYTIPVLYAALAAMLWTSVRSLRRFEVGHRDLHLATLAAGVMILGLVPASYTFRVFEHLHYLVPFFAGILFAAVLKLFRVGGRIVGVQVPRSTLAIIAAGGLAFLQMSLVSSPAALIDRSTTKATGGMATGFVASDLEMASWIRDNTQPDTVLVSDPVQQQLLMAMGERDALGGNYTSDERQTLLKQAFRSPDPEQASGLFLQAMPQEYQGRNILIVVSGRTEQFTLTEQNYVWNPQILQSTSQLLSKFWDRRYYELVHQVDGQIYAFRLLQHQGESEP